MNSINNYKLDVGGAVTHPVFSIRNRIVGVGILLSALVVFGLPFSVSAQSCTGENFGAVGTCQPVASCTGNNTDTSPTCQSGQVCCTTNAISTGSTGSTGTNQGAQGFTALAPIPGLTDTSVTSVIKATSLAAFFNNLYKYLIGLGATLAVIQIIWAGLDIAIWHKDAVSAITDDKGKIYNAVFGLVLLLSPVLVFTIINPSILNLSLNLPPLDTSSGPQLPASNTTNISERTTSDVGGAVAQAQAQCRAQGGTPKTDSGSIAGGTVNVTCDMTPAPTAGSTITQTQCVNLTSPQMYTGSFNCTTAPASMQSFEKAGGYTCNDLTGGGICLHK